MGEVIPMDSLSRGVKPNEKTDMKDRAPGGQVFDEKGRNAPENIEHPPGGVSRGGPSYAGNNIPPSGSVARNARSAGPSGETGDKMGNLGNRLNNLQQNMPKGHQKALQKKLGQLQKAAPEISKKLAGGALGQLSLAKDVLSQIDPLRDWIFLFLLFPFALLKDIFDILLSPIPGVGVVVSFITMIMVLLLTIVAMLIAGSDLKNRGLSKYIIGLSLGSIAEALPGIGWFPIALAEAILIYGFTIFDRLMTHYEQKSEGKKSEENEEAGQIGSTETQPQYADNYPAAEPERKAA